MVYTIRHKGFWDYAVGNGYYDRNFHNFIKKIEPPKEQTLFITRKNDSYFPFRYLHVYRTLKRAGNQFFQGNELIQNVFTLSLRAMYQRVPEEMFTQRYGGWDMLVHKGERHWELMTYNQHPLQQDLYEMVNKYIHETQGEKSEEEKERALEFVKKLDTLTKQKKERLGLKEYETLEQQDLADTFDEAMKEERAARGSQFYVKPQEEVEKEDEIENPRRVSYFY
ncbi:unnamed protein product [Blepharisma stoltei]|uniref:Uncharacterized protein n=1 Tax=Blepharisma stoltei TaxID=1481888 RepID=A0AAU9INQ8_9CILI|nr:unnamed protein product [Blepharisma stoltei]